MVAGVAMGNSVLVDVLNQNKDTFASLATFDDSTWDRAVSQVQLGGDHLTSDQLYRFFESLNVDR